MWQWFASPTRKIQLPPKASAEPSRKRLGKRQAAPLRGTVEEPSTPSSVPQQEEVLVGNQNHISPNGSTDEEDIKKKLFGYKSKPLVILQLNDPAKRKVVALIDTGAAVSCISASMCHILNIPLKSAPPMSLRAINNQLIQVAGYIETPILLPGGLEVTFRGMAVLIPSCPLILGQNFLNEFKASVDFNNQCLSLQGTSIPFITKHDE